MTCPVRWTPGHWKKTHTPPVFPSIVLVPKARSLQTFLRAMLMTSCTDKRRKNSQEVWFWVILHAVIIRKSSKRKPLLVHHPLTMIPETIANRSGWGFGAGYWVVSWLLRCSSKDISMIKSVLFAVVDNIVSSMLNNNQTGKDPFY